MDAFTLTSLLGPAGRGRRPMAGVPPRPGPPRPGSGDTIFVAATVPHRFHDVTEELRVIVVFGPAEYSRSSRQADPLDA